MAPLSRGAGAAKRANLPGFADALLCALRFDCPDTHGLTLLSEASWRDLLAFCDLAHLTLPLLQRCRTAIPDWVIARAQRNRADNAIRVERVQSAYREIKMALDQAGVPHLVIKGFAQFPEFTEALEDRMQSDIDLYCPQEHISAARAVLMGLGYEGDRTLENYPADHLPEMTRRRGWIWRGNMYDPEMPPAVDLHFCFWNESASRLSVPGVDQFWARRVVRLHHEHGFPALCRVDHLAFNALHVLRDLVRGDWVLHHVYELAWFLNTHADDLEFWESWRATHDDRLCSLQAISFWLAREWFHCRWAAAVDLEITAMPQPVLRWLMTFAESPLSGMFQPNKHGVWLHLALLESRWDKLHALGAALVPLRLPAVGAPGQNASKTRHTRRRWPSHRWARYLLHVAFRAAFHLQTLVDTLWHGLRWWRYQR